jgi:hypothetical protein
VLIVLASLAAIGFVLGKEFSSPRLSRVIADHKFTVLAVKLFTIGSIRVQHNVTNQSLVNLANVSFLRKDGRH